MEGKLDELISLVTNLNEKFDTFDSKVEKLSKKMEIFEETVNDKFAQVDNELKCKAPLAHCNELQEKISSLKDQLGGLYSDIKKDALLKESYEKRLNILMHELREPDSLWEKREESLTLFQDFMRDGLNIDDPTSIALFDAHRLPQRPKYNKGTCICRPLIVKLATISDKNKIFSHLKNLKNCDETRNSSLLHHKSVYVSNHLPREFVLQKKRLYPQCKEALSNNQKPRTFKTKDVHCLCPAFASEGDHLYYESAIVLMKSTNNWRIIVSD